MSDNRTTELRKLLDERGVDWTKPKSATEFIQTTFLRNGWGIEVLERNIGLCVTATNIFDTPEQVIAATLGSDAKPCYATDYTHRRCKYSVNRGWTEDTKFYVPTLRNGTLTAEQVREAVMSADRWEKPMRDTGLTNTHLIIRDDGWQAIADELNARAERTCRNENGNDKYANFICSECGLHMHKPVFGRSYVDEDGKRWYGTSSEHGLHYCPNCGAKVVGE